MMRKAFLLTWYFVLIAGNAAQIGPFATQAACTNYQALVRAQFSNADFSYLPCFNSVAKQ